MIMRAVCDSRVSKRERAAKKKKKLARIVDATGSLPFVLRAHRSWGAL